MKPTKVLFVEPTGSPSNIFAKYMNIPLLGPVFLATIAKGAGFDVSIFNENISRRSMTERELAEIDVLCLSCVTATINRGKEIAAQYRKARSNNGLNSRVLVGGIHASMIPDDVMEVADQIVIGEAENCIVDILSGKISDKIIHGGKIEDLDSLPIPDLSLVNEYEKMTVIPIMTSRGCPYDCNFCSVTEMFGRRYRSQSPQRVIEEVLYYSKNKSWIFFVDDHFAADQKRTDEILDLMIKHRIRRKWSAQVRTEITKNPEFIAKMRRAGCKIVYVGFESINPDTLKDMNKRQTVEDIKRSIKVFHKNGISVHGMFMLGNDADTPEVISLTSEFCRKSGIDYVQYSILTPLPGTKVFKQFEEEGRLLHKDWSRYDGLHVVFKPKAMLPHELQKGMIKSYRQFYSYMNAVNDCFTIFSKAVLTFFQNFYTKKFYLSPFPIVMKVFGRNIIRKWEKDNLFYMSDLKE